ncbi:MAG TPA: hypothetical protein VK589_25845 [Chryseolinea sp.]|nr:hypothetical protein [Chryseolinea sp.]
MNARQRQYLFGAIFLGFGIYQLVLKDVLEASLYMVAGAAFIFNTVASEPSLSKFKKVLVAITWVLIITAGVLFLYLLQFKFL